MGNTIAKVDKIRDVGADWSREFANLNNELHRAPFEVEGKKIHSLQDLYMVLDDHYRDRDWVAHKKNSRMVVQSALLGGKNSPMLALAKTVRNAADEFERIEKSFPSLLDSSVYQTRELTTRISEIKVDMSISVGGKMISLSDAIEDMREAYNADIAPGAMDKNAHITDIARSVIETLEMREMRELMDNSFASEVMIVDLEEVLEARKKHAEQRAKDAKNVMMENQVYAETLIRNISRIDQYTVSFVRAQITAVTISKKWADHLIEDAIHLEKILHAMKALAKKHKAPESFIKMLTDLPTLKLI